MRAYELLTKSIQVLSEGGNAFPDVGTIHIDEIQPTLKSLANFLGMPEVVNNAIGSVGKAEYSGDIDIVIDLERDEVKELSDELRTKLGNQSVTGVAGNVTFRYPIANYDETKQGRQPRTGKVQVDIIPGDAEWYKTYYHSAGDTSKFKGVHRGLAIAMVAKHIDVKQSEELDDFGRPVESVRWMWGQKNGLTKVRKTSRKNKNTGKYVKKQDTEQLTPPLKSPDKIANILFRCKAGPEALNSLESIIDAVKKAYSSDEQNEIFASMARAFSEGKLLDNTAAIKALPLEIRTHVQ